MPLKLITHLAKLVLIPSLLLAHSELQAKEKKRAQVLWGYCGHQPYAPPAYLDLSSDPLQAPTHLHADEAEGQFDASYTLQGNVRLGDLTTATSSDRGTFNFITQQGRVENSHYRIYNHHARGSAQTIIFDGPTRMQLKFAQFTTCDEDSDAWYINSQSVRLDQESGLGTAAPVYITFYHVPILFSPYIYFPIDDRRQTGFLVPSFKTSSISGTQISTPFYINLDPQYDLTVTPRNMTRRGLLVENEFRYLLTQGNGSVQANFLQSDNIYNEDRYLLALQHSATPAPNWLFNANLSRASDKEYLNDFGNDLNLAA
ncbi:MAG: LPS-assembly protein, partial [Halothiobacillaceae bacterium]